MARGLLALPEAALQEVLSWSPSYTDAAAFFNTCCALNQLHTDPVSAALLLLRRPAHEQDSSTKALAACSRCRGGSSAVVEQVLQRLKASPDSGGPHVAPEPLLQAMLNSSCETGAVASMLALLHLLPPSDGDPCTELPRVQALLYRACSAGAAPSISALLALAAPPNVNSLRGWALDLALEKGPHMEALQVLLDHGADPCTPSAARSRFLPLASPQQQMLLPSYRLFKRAAVAPGRFVALQLLLQRCPASQRTSAASAALHSAVLHRNCAAVAHLLPLPREEDDAEYAGHVNRAATCGDCDSLRLLLAHQTVAGPCLNRSLHAALQSGHAECVEMLLDHGANAHGAFFGSSALELAIQGCLGPVRDGKGDLGARLAVVTVLLRRGVTVTSAMQAYAWEAAGSAEKGAALRDVARLLDEALQWQAETLHESL